MKNIKFEINSKFIDIFCYVFCGIYIFFFFCFAFIQTQNNIEIQNKLDQMILYTNSVNKKIEDSKFFITTEKDEVISTEPLFTDGKVALLTAYNNTINANSFYGEATGTMTTVAMGVSVKVSTFTQVIKYSDNKFYDSRANVVLETNASGAILNMVKDLSNCGVKALCEDGQTYKYESDEISLKNNIPVANFSKSKKINDNNTPIIAKSLYVVSEETILDITYFKTKYKNGVPVEYYVQAKLDPKKSTINYKNILKTGAELTEDPKFKSCTITVVINANGHVTSVNTIDESTILKMGSDCPCKMVQTYTISGVNETITFVDGDF